METYQFVVLMAFLTIGFLFNCIHKNAVLRSIESIEKEMKDYHKFKKGRNK